MMRHRWVFGAVASVAIGWHGQSDATVVRAVALDEIVSTSVEVVVATVVDSKSHYATFHGHQRMVTDSTLLIDHVVMANRASTSNESQTITIRKLGGTTDGVAQIVYGEAALARNTTVLVFLRLGSDGQFWVSAMAQGEYRVETATDGVPRLQRSRNLDMVVHPERSVVETLDGTTLKQAEAIVNASIAKTRKLP